MRNWNPQFSWCWTASRLALRLPMRNWNLPSSRLLPRSHRTLSDYLWGIETHKKWDEEYDDIVLSDYLWGIETPWKNIAGFDYRIALRLPMRNWNSSRGSSSLGFAPCSQTTYEELKLRTFPLGSCGSNALRLPMRNWNSKAFEKCRESPVWLSDYLWGIETSQDAINIPKIVFALRLPMRNWNSGFQNGLLKPVYLALRLPMRNWNSRSWVQSLWEWIRLSDYLWGIETHPIRLVWLWSYGLSDYLWGIETHSPFVSFVSSQPALRLPMRNWNFVLVYSNTAWYRLSDYLWGIETRTTQRIPIMVGALRLPMRNWNSN